VGVIVAGRVLGVWVKVAVLDLAVAMRVNMKTATAPAQQQPDREEHDHQPDERLGAPLDRLGQVSAEDDDRQPEDGQRQCMARPPGHAEPSGPLAAAGRVGCDQGRYRGQMVRVGGVPEAEQQRHGEGDEQRLSLGQAREALV
jgi:hypothetical protein